MIAKHSPTKLPTWSRRRFCKTSVFTAASTAALAYSPNLLTAQPQKATVSVHLKASKVQYSPHLFGQFIEHFHRQIHGGIFEPGSPFSDEQGFRKDVLEALRELKVPIVRWPGGCFVSAYHWKYGVGKERTPVFDKAWRVEDPNTFGTDEFVTWCRKLNAEPYICTNAGTGSPEEMSDWVEYCNLKDQGPFAKMRQANGYPEPHRVQYWSIGNENYGDWELGAKTVEEWGHFVCESAKLMLRADPTIKLLAAANADRNWTVPLLQQAGRYLQYISIHGYWDPLWQENNPSDYLTCMMRTVEPEQSILQAIAILQETGFEQMKIAFDEWNLRGWHHPGHHPPTDNPALIAARDKNDLNETYTMADACFSACFLNSCLRHAGRVAMANMAPVVNARGPLFVHPGGIVKRTTFHVMKLYANLLESYVAPCRIECVSLSHEGREVPALDAIATCDESGKTFALALTNRHPDEAVECRFTLDERVLARSVQATTLSGDSPDAYNDISQPERVVPEVRTLHPKDGMVSLPPHSVTMLRFS